jgi:hypothetical protein
MDTQDKLQRAYARLTALRGALEAERKELVQFPEKFVREYHGALHHLAESGYDVDEFKIPDEEVRPRVISSDMAGHDEYSADRWVDRGLIMAKLGAILAYFELKNARPKSQLGFHGQTK